MMTVAVIFVCLLGALLFVLLPATSTVRRAISVGIFLTLSAIVYAGAIELMGRPKPINVEWRTVAKDQLVSAFPIENEAIYVWLKDPDSSEPRAYSLPWSEKVAQQLQNAMNAAEAEGTSVEMTMRSGTGSEGEEPLFSAVPQRPSPAKNYESNAQPLNIDQAPAAVDSVR